MGVIVTFVFLIGAIVTALGSLATLLLSPKPRGLCGNLLSLARLGVFGGGVGAAARVLAEGQGATLERAVLMMSLAVLYVLQVHAEVQRQRQEGKA
jgi:hypothetical protein